MFWNRKNKGIITVFVTLMMVPIVVCTGTFVDVARMKMYSSQAVMAADSYGEAVLSEYDNLLKELYGLFSVTQNEDGKAAIEELAEYTKCSFNPSIDGVKYSCGHDPKVNRIFMPYANAELGISHEAIEESSLANPNVLITQISDFMQFRIVEQVMEEKGLLTILDQFKSVDANMDAINQRNKISESSRGVLEKISEYYEVLKKIAAYPDYKDTKRYGYNQYAITIDDVYTKELNVGVSEEYEDQYTYKTYYEYEKNKTAIENARDKQKQKEENDAINEAAEEERAERESIAAANGTEPDYSGIETADVITLTQEEQNLVDTYEGFDAQKYKDAMHETLINASVEAEKNPGPINFDTAGDDIKDLSKKAKKITDNMEELQEQIEELNKKLEACTDEEFKKQMKEEIKDLETIANQAGGFMKVYDLIETVNKNSEKNENNSDKFSENIDILDDIADDLMDLKKEPGQTIQMLRQIEFEWYDFMEDDTKGYFPSEGPDYLLKDFYDMLKSLCEVDTSGVEGDKKAGEKKADEADKKTEEYNKKLKEDAEKEENDPSIRNIEDDVYDEFENGKSSYKTPDLASMLKNGLQFDDLTTVGNGMLGKFLLVSYDFGMFSSRVSGIEPPEEDNKENAAQEAAEAVEESVSEVTEALTEDQEEEKEEYYDESLTKVKMSKDVNYLYKAELEYLYGGKAESKDNLADVRNTINAVRFTMNFTSTYMIGQVNSAINAAANAAASAVIATGVGAGAAPLIRALVSGALRTLVATAETAADWSALKSRKEVVFLKTKLDQLEIKDELESLIGKEFDKNKGATEVSTLKDFALSYEDYLLFLLLITRSDDTLAYRTANLITLNVNQSQNSEDKLESLDFRMEDTRTAVKALCSVKLDFVIVPEHFMNLFFEEEGSKAEEIIHKLNDSGYQYSVIRGY